MIAAQSLNHLFASQKSTSYSFNIQYMNIIFLLNIEIKWWIKLLFDWIGLGNITLFSLPHFQIDPTLRPSSLIYQKPHVKLEVAYDHYQLRAYSETFDLGSMLKQSSRVSIL